MTRRKGERSVQRPLQRWTPEHPVARMIATGDRWFAAWTAQMATPYVRLSKVTGIPLPRLDTISRGDVISRAELDALARAWCVSSADLMASTPDPTIVID